MLCVQEHWLLSLEKNIISDLHKDFSSSIKSVDDEDPLLDYKSQRGYGGTAIFWRKELTSAVNIMPDGNTRIQVLTINSKPASTCLINLYMPSAQLNGDMEYNDTLDQINEIIDKYKETYQIILCGDMNASLHRDNRRRDQLFKNFIVANNLSIPQKHPVHPTFFHHNGKYTSQTDYFLFEDRAIHQLKTTVRVRPMHPTNTSDHTLVTADITLAVKKSALRPVKIYTKPNWEKCDDIAYKSSVSEEIKTSQKSQTSSVESRIKQLETSMHKAGAK